MAILKTILAILLSACLAGPCIAAELTTSPDPATEASTTGSATSATPSTPAPAAPKKVLSKSTSTKANAARTSSPKTIAPKTTSTSKTTAAKSKTTTKPATTTKTVASKYGLRTEAELSGFSSESSEAFHSRLNLTHTSPKHKWWIKTDYGFTTSKNYGRTRITESQTSGYDIDASLRRNRKGDYSFVSLIAGNKKRTPHSSTYYDSSDFRMFSVGYGRTILPGVEFETSVAQITRDKGGADDRIAPLYTIRIKKPVNPSLTMDADVHVVQPWSQDSLVDSRMNLTYKLTSSLSMRLTYVANNVLGTNLTKREWDKLFRVSLVFAR